ncbi:MAG: CotH kinase family protein [Lachnospiraceae bacterium]|nr:CotH kinase family protein [Lachnospiraceae bacterium]
MLRNFGTQDGELYKPDSMEMGGAAPERGSGEPAGFEASEKSGRIFSDISSGGGPGGNFPGGGFPGGGERPEGMPDMGDFKPGDMPDMGDFNPGDFDPSNIPDFDPENMPDFNPGEMPEEAASDTDDKSDNIASAAADTNGSTGETPDDDSDSTDERPDRGSFDKSGERPERPDSDSDSGSEHKGPGGGGFSMGGKGANLNYSDDDLDSYSTIWEGEITDTSKGDYRRVVTALKNISEGTDIEKYMDVDNILKYMAVHTFSVNMDSLSGSMAHNYYLYEYNGQLNIFPWDYNLSLGGMSMGKSGGADDMINDAIDTPFDSTGFFDALLENEEYLEIYHGYLRQLAEEYVEGGRFEEVYNRIRNQIDELVKTDPTAFYSEEEYEAAAEMLYKTVTLRAESIIGQLNGTIPSTDEGQKADSSSFIDASDIDTSVMGSFNMGGVKEGEEGKRRGGRTKAGEAVGNRMRPSFGEMQGQVTGKDLIRNIIILSICFASVIIVLFVIKKRARIM